MILSAMSLMAAEDKTIYVTTFADEDGENTSACSCVKLLRRPSWINPMEGVMLAVHCVMTVPLQMSSNSKLGNTNSIVKLLLNPMSIFWENHPSIILKRSPITFYIQYVRL